MYIANSCQFEKDQGKEIFCGLSKTKIDCKHAKKIKKGKVDVHCELFPSALAGYSIALSRLRPHYHTIPQDIIEDAMQRKQSLRGKPKIVIPVPDLSKI